MTRDAPIPHADRFAILARAVIAAMPSAEQIRREQIEKDAQIAQRESEANEIVAKVHAGRGDMQSASRRFAKYDVAKHIASAIRAQLKDKPDDGVRQTQIEKLRGLLRLANSYIENIESPEARALCARIAKEIGE